MLRILRNASIAAAGIYLLMLVTLYVAQRNLVFSTSAERILPADIGVQNVEEVTLRTEAGDALYSWYGRAKSTQPTILYLHGNGGSVSTRKDKYRQLMEKGYGLFMLGYPGYGGSDGAPSEESFIAAAHLAHRYLQTELTIDPTDIVIFGESLGSAVAIQLAAKKPAKALVLSAPMSSIREIAENQYPFFPLRWLLKDPFLSIDHIVSVNMPLLVFHGSADTAIPITSGRKLFSRANHPKTFHTIEGGEHNNLFDYPLVEMLQVYLKGLSESG